ncbi:MAG: DUF4214 domain-containing protein [Symploca sp. SIO3C6]|nr:DUF4214 domain-containing protein [Symploca sp. SIO3C6]NET07448.1 DUF4214 domain-containing protein [Symploca sp. SIO2B6]
MKPILLTITGLIMTTALAAPAQAQRRYCIVSEYNSEVVCGRRATEREVEWYNRRYDRRERRRDDGRYDRRYDNSRDTRRRDYVYREINDLYRDVLGRSGDRRGIRTYADRILSGDWDYAKVRRELAGSREARERINQLYREILRRDADRDGLRTYQKNLERGWSLERVRRDLLESDEARRSRAGGRIRRRF